VFFPVLSVLSLQQSSGSQLLFLPAAFDRMLDRRLFSIIYSFLFQPIMFAQVYHKKVRAQILKSYQLSAISYQFLANLDLGFRV
jgi:hypothetical protein